MESQVAVEYRACGSSNGDVQTQSYSFDAMGNRLSRQDSASGTTNSTTYAYNAANMLLSTGGAGASGFQNDADGNTLTGNGRTMAWDSQNRLVSCIIGGNTTAYRYGADGLRRQSTKNGLSTDYAYDGQNMIREGHATGGTLTPSTVTATYLIGARGPEYRRDDTQAEVDSQGRTVTKARWYVFDGLGSVVGEVDPLGNLTSSPKYDVYGAVRANGGTATSKQGFVGALGHVSDDTGLVYMQARYMDPSLGRFESQDPGVNGTNWYVYCNNNPVNDVDRDGKSALSIWLEIGAIDVACYTSKFFCGTFLAACCFLFLPELPLLAGVATGSIAGADDMALALMLGISSSYNMAVKGGNEVASKGLYSIGQEAIGFAIGYAALIMLTSDFMDAVDSR